MANSAAKGKGEAGRRHSAKSMKKGIFRKVLVLFLALAMVLSIPVESSAATRVVTARNTNTKSRIPSIKTGKTTVIAKYSTEGGYVKFRSTKTRYYTITLSNVRQLGKSSSASLVMGVGAAAINTTYKSGSVYTTQNGTRTPYLVVGSSRYYKLYRVLYSTTTYKTPKTSRSMRVRLKKGQTLYLALTNTMDSCNICYDVKIK